METQTATFAAGCFWGVEHLFRQLPGVIDTQVGYTGGQAPDPSYEQVCHTNTGHAEAVQVTFDPAHAKFEDLLLLFFGNHDPTTVDRQGADIGTQYRSAVFFHDAAQQAAAEKAKSALDASGRFGRPIVTQIVPARPFYRAEEHHQRYLEKRGESSCQI